MSNNAKYDKHEMLLKKRYREVHPVALQRMKEREREANAILENVRCHARLKCSPGLIELDINGELRPLLKADVGTLRGGSIAQGAGAKMLSMARRDNLAEGKALEMLLVYIADTNREDVAFSTSQIAVALSRVTSILWDTAPFEIWRAAKIARKFTPATRAAGSRFIGAAGIANPERGLAFGEQAINSASILSQVPSGPHYGARAGRGESITSLMAEADIDLMLRALQPGALLEVRHCEHNAIGAMIRGLLSRGIDFADIPVSKQRRLIRSMKPLLASIHRIHNHEQILSWAAACIVEQDFAIQPTQLIETVADWASSLPESPKPKLGSWTEVLARAFRWANTQITENKALKEMGALAGPLPEIFQDVEVDGFDIGQPRTGFDILRAGIELHICLRHLAPRYAMSFKANRSHLLFVCQDAKLISVAEVDANCQVIQHRAAFNQPPSRAAARALENFLNHHVGKQIQASKEAQS